MMCFGMKDRKRARTNHCVIVLLDDTQLVHELHASSTGQDLLDVVIKHLNLLETAYFGLKYLKGPAADDHSGQRPSESVWLEGDKCAIRQLRHVQPMTVYFGIKFYAPDPCKLAEEITRYQFFLQCKQDILHGRLPVSFDLAVDLFALAIQSELGDYDPQRHLEGYVSEFQFSPNQTMELEARAALCHRTLAGQVPASAEMSLLERVKWLDLYGCELHPIQYEDNGEEYALGLNPAGVLVLRNKQKVALNPWSRIVKTKCQGRCFLMDVIEGKPSGEQTRNRFGFRLADKAASRRLAQAMDEHKTFHHLIRSSASLKQLAHHQNQHQQLKLSQRFRNSIRSAINIGPLASLQHQQQLRSSMKSIANHQLMQQQQQQHHQQQQLCAGLEARPQPTVVRMPSRRYSNRSQSRPQYFNGAHYNAAGNGNGLPAPSLMGLPGQGAHTMVDSQRQQALLLMSQLHQQHAAPSRSQTLRPMAHHNRHEMKEAKRNPYYQMMMMMASQQQQQQQQAQRPDLILPGRHFIQPASIYKSNSMMNGLHQMVDKQSVGPMFYNGQPQWAPNGATRGFESPRSTKSALGSSSAMRQASRKLAKQQLFYDNNNQDVQPLLAYDSAGSTAQQRNPGVGNTYYGIASGAYSASVSPRSVRSARLASRHKSQSTNENLNLIHEQQQQQQHRQHQRQKSPVKSASNNKMLLATAQQMMPAHLAGSNAHQQGQQFAGSENEHSDASQSRRPTDSSRTRKRTTFALDTNQQQHQQVVVDNSLSRCVKQRQPPIRSDDDDYYCSRSDCSSDGATKQQQQQHQRSQRAKRPLGSDFTEQVSTAAKKLDDQKEWNAIRKKHNEYLLAGAGGGGPLLSRQQQVGAEKELAMECNSQLIKNIANKQATPILLSMNYEQTNANNKAIQLLNLQRQQLNSSSDTGTKSSSPVTTVNGSANSSLASSPKVPLGPSSGGGSMMKTSKTAESTGSSSTTSGFYAGSNSIGSGSLDSDRDPSPTSNSLADPKVAPGVGSRAKIALGSYGGASTNRRTTNMYKMDVASSPVKSDANSPTNASVTSDSRLKMKQHFYLGENNNNNNVIEHSIQSPKGSEHSATDSHGPQWSPLNQIQQAASLKYVSFDV